MSGKDAKTLEDTLIQRLDQVDSLLESNEENDSNIKSTLKKYAAYLSEDGLDQSMMHFMRWEEN